MSKMDHSDFHYSGIVSADRVDHLTTSAQTRVTTTESFGQMVLKQKIEAILLDAAISTTSRPFGPLVGRLLADGVTVEEIADIHIPEVARTLGAKWAEDEIGFASVTIGTARLQALLRELGPEWHADGPNNGDAPGLLIVVMEKADHTLGAMVLAGQMRRRGLSVRLMLGATPAALDPVMRQVRFDAVLISSSIGESLDMLGDLVSAVKSSTGYAPPVVIGGTLVAHDPARAAEIAAETGADFVTNDPEEALALCGLGRFGLNRSDVGRPAAGPSESGKPAARAAAQERGSR